MSNRRRKLIWIIPAAIVAMAVFIFVGGLVVRFLWNWLLPPLFGWPQLGFWQALALLALCRILFGGFGFHGRRSDFRGRMMARRWARMTPEEREKFRQSFRGGCAPFEPPGPNATA